MYPANYLALFPPFPLDNRVFVAMSFAPQFENRWTNVIAPAITSVTWGGKPLIPFRVDQRTISDSILTEILNGIGRCRMFFADISTIGILEGRPMRNANVMYEVGIAHAVRMPSEVVLFRSDNHELNFDVTNVRVNYYEPDGRSSPPLRTVSNAGIFPDFRGSTPASLRGEALNKVQAAILNGLNEVQLMRHLSVQRAASRIDMPGWNLLNRAMENPIVPTEDIFQPMIIHSLLEEGVLETYFEKFSIESFHLLPDLKWTNVARYRVTPFGVAVFQHFLASTDFQKILVEAERLGMTVDQYHRTVKAKLQANPSVNPPLQSDVSPAPS